MFVENVKIESPNATIVGDEIVSNYEYQTTVTSVKGNTVTVVPKSENVVFKTKKDVPKLG